jgi:hypothetical protein
MRAIMKQRRSKMRGKSPSSLLGKPTVSTAHLAAAINAAGPMSLKEKEAVCDTLYVTQPNLLGTVLVLPSLGVKMETVDVVLNILIVLHLAVEKSGQTLAVVSEQDVERQLHRFTATVLFAEGLDAHAFEQSLQQTVAYRKQPVLLAHVIDVLRRSGIADQPHENAKYPMMAAINLVNCIATAKRTGG